MRHQFASRQCIVNYFRVAQAFSSMGSYVIAWQQRPISYLARRPYRAFLKVLLHAAFCTMCIVCLRRTCSRLVVLFVCGCFALFFPGVNITQLELVGVTFGTLGSSVQPMTRFLFLVTGSLHG